jgi:pyrroloquinoline quinone biosynthesis protein B
LARAGSREVTPRTQSSVAVSADGEKWFLLNVSPDIRQQIAEFPALAPQGEGLRGTGIAGCFLTDAEIDHTSGLLLLREDTLFQIYSTPIVQRFLSENFPILPMLLAFRPRPWNEAGVGTPFLLRDAFGNASTLRVTPINMPGHAPIYAGPWKESTAGANVALRIEDTATGGVFLYAPAIASITPELDAAAQGADAILMDGTFWTLNEMVGLGLTKRNAADMGHVVISGPEGSLQWLARQPARHRAYVHINNTNPVLNASSPERRVVEAAGIRVGCDGDEFVA